MIGRTNIQKQNITIQQMIAGDTYVKTGGVLSPLSSNPKTYSKSFTANKVGAVKLHALAQSWESTPTTRVRFSISKNGTELISNNTTDGTNITYPSGQSSDIRQVEGTVTTDISIGDVINFYCEAYGANSNPKIRKFVYELSFDVVETVVNPDTMNPNDMWT